MVICFKHPSYRGLSAPEVHCSTCCKIFLLHLKKQVNQGIEPKVPFWEKGTLRQNTAKILKKTSVKKPARQG